MNRNKPLARKTPLKASKGFNKAKSSLSRKKPSTGNSKPIKRKSKTSLAKLKEKLWAECRRIIRLRYQKHTGGWDCYTCGAYLAEPAKAQTGHFIPSSVCSTELRYDLDNLRIQCYSCNINKSGNWIEYEKHLRKEMGEDYPERLKARNESTKGQMYREDWYEMYLKNYKEIV